MITFKVERKKSIKSNKVMIDTWCIVHCCIVAPVKSFKWNKNSFDVKIFWLKVKLKFWSNLPDLSMKFPDSNKNVTFWKFWVVLESPSVLSKSLTESILRGENNFPSSLIIWSRKGNISQAGPNWIINLS